MIITTTHSVEGRQIAAYLDVVSAESVQGINVVRDMFAGMRDFFGGRSQTLEKALREARAQATDELKERAAKLQADAVVGVNFEISMPSGKASMLVVFVTGTRHLDHPLDQGTHLARVVVVVATGHPAFVTLDAREPQHRAGGDALRGLPCFVGRAAAGALTGAAQPATSSARMSSRSPPTVVRLRCFIFLVSSLV